MFRTLTVITYNDKTPEKQSLYKYESEDEAVAQFHKQFGYMTADNVKAILGITINEAGGVIKNEYWEKKVAQAEQPTEQATEQPTEQTTEQ